MKRPPRNELNQGSSCCESCHLLKIKNATQVLQLRGGVTNYIPFLKLQHPSVTVFMNIHKKKATFFSLLRFFFKILTHKSR